MRSLSSILTGGEDDSSYGHLTMRSLIRCWEDGDLLWQLRAVQGFAQFSLGTPNNHNTRFMEQWVNDMEEFVKALSQSQENDPEAYKRHYQHLQVFLDAGVFDAFAGMPVTFKGKLPDLCYRALKVLRALMEAIRDPAEFEESLEKMLGLGGVGAIKLQMTLESTGPLLRSVAIACFREMYTRACLSEGISAEKFAKQLQAFLVCFEKSHYKQVLEQWNEPQSLLRREIEGLYGKIESTQVENHLRRWSQSNQQIALEAALAMFEYRVEPMSRKFALEVLQKEQYILPLLLVAASEERPSWNITRETDSLAALILVHLMRLPMNVIPGSEAPLGCSNSAEQEEWDAAMECNRKLWTTEVALEAVIKMRKKIINENIAVLENALRDSVMASSSVVAGASSGGVQDKTLMLEQQLIALHRNRAIMIVAQLRLLINSTYFEEASDSLLLALLPLAYRACQRLLKDRELRSNNPDEQSMIDSKKTIGETEIMRSFKPPVAHLGPIVNAYVAPITILGPTLLFRLLFKLSKLGYGLRKLQNFSEPSADSFNVHGLYFHVVHIHQISSSKVVGKLIRMSIDRRISRHREMANKRLLGEKEKEFSPLTFASAAELALAQLAFGSHSHSRGLPAIQHNQRSFALAKKEVVVCVGNASEAAGRTGEWMLCRSYAKIAVDFCDTVSDDEAKLIGWDVASLKAKNQRRYTYASSQLK